MGFRQDMVECQKAAQVGPLGVRRAALIAVLSAQQQWSRIPGQLHDVELNGLKSSALYGSKRAAFKFLEVEANLDYLYAGTMTENDPVDLLDLWLSVPSLGLVKGGFVVQLTRGKVGCIDTHNAKRYDVSRNQLRLDKAASPGVNMRKVQEYVRLCEDLGGADHLWIEWCYLMAAKYPNQYLSAEDVSGQHVEMMQWSQA
jgi:hypothetical protein